MSVTKEEELAWQKFVEADIAHRGHNDGHNSEGMGSPITKIVLEHHDKNYKEIFIKLHPDTPENYCQTRKNQ